MLYFQNSESVNLEIITFWKCCGVTYKSSISLWTLNCLWLSRKVS